MPDADAEMRFLKTAFGAAEASCHRNADQTVMHAELRVGDSRTRKKEIVIRAVRIVR